MWLNNKPKTRKQMVAVAPHHYRRLVDGAWASLMETGHGSDTILIGETSPRGGKKPSQLGNAMAPAEFVREMYCLQRNFKPYKGKAARIRNCPDTGAKRRRFRAAHPGLFNATGYAHHPYSLNTRRWELPTWRHKDPDNIAIGNIRKLTSTLDRAQFYWGSLRPPMSIWFTEYGYQTRPPDPTAGVAPDRQGPLSAWGEYIAYKNPRVASIAQFLLIDDGPVPGASGRSRWVSWQSGLFLANGDPKPFLQDFQRPLHIVGKGRRIRLFGIYRPAPDNKPTGVGVQYLQDRRARQPVAVPVDRGNVERARLREPARDGSRAGLRAADLAQPLDGHPRGHPPRGDQVTPPRSAATGALGSGPCLPRIHLAACSAIRTSFASAWPSWPSRCRAHRRSRGRTTRSSSRST